MKRLWIVAAGIHALLAGPVSAQEGENNEGFYLGYGLGEFSSDVDLETVDDVDLDSDDAQKIFGGWRFNQFFAVNLDYTDFGDSRGALGVSSDTEGLTPGIIGTIPLGPIELFGKVGVMFYDVTVDGGGPLVDSSGEDAVLGLGIGATFFERFNITGEYERVDIENLDDAEAVWLTASWRF
jgi:OOP family OmpA-OmpF porin